MSIKELIAKAMTQGLDALTEEERKQLEAYQEPDVEKVANDRAARARKEAEGKLATREAEYAKLQEELDLARKAQEEKVNKDLTEIQRVEKRMEKLGSDFAAAQKEAAEAKAENARLIRAHRIDGIFSKLTFIPGVDRDAMRVLVDHHLRDVTDLGDEETINDRLEEFKTKNKPLIFVEGAAGTGSGGDGGAGGGGAGGGGAGGGGGRPKGGPIDTKALLEQALTGDVKAAEEALRTAGESARAGARVIR